MNNPDDMINLSLRNSKVRLFEGSKHGFQKTKKTAGPFGYGLYL
jgi:hypothetical protein